MQLTMKATGDHIDQIQIASFHVLAYSKGTFFNQTHLWHMQMNRKFAAN